MKGKEITIHWEKVYPKFKAIVQEEGETTVKVLYCNGIVEIDKKYIVNK